MALINIDPNYNPSVRVRQRREGENIKRYRYPILARESVEIVVCPDNSAAICFYPSCVDNGPDGKCTAWLDGICRGPKI